MAEMTIEEIKATYPANTVYLSYDKGGHINGAIPFDFYAERKKTYSDCCEKMKVERVECTFKEVQDASTDFQNFIKSALESRRRLAALSLYSKTQSRNYKKP